MDTVAYTDAGVRQIKRADHLRNWKLVILLVVLLTSYIDSSDQCCRGGNASFTWDYTLPPFIVIEWYVNDTQIAETSEPSFSQNVLDINSDYTRRFRLHKIGAIGFDIINVTEADEGDYRCLVTSETGILKELKQKLQVKGIKPGDYHVTVTNTTEDCRTLKCGEPVGTNPTYEWSIRVNGSDEKPIRTSTNTFIFCRNHVHCSVKCQRDHDCTETTWICFTPGQSGRRRRKRRTLDEQLVPCDEQLVPCDEQLVPCDLNQRRDTSSDDEKAMHTFCSRDPIPANLVYDKVEILLPTNTRILNLSETSSIMANDFKTAFVKPLINKMDCIVKPKNYRPVSNLSLT